MDLLWATTNRQRQDHHLQNHYLQRFQGHSWFTLSDWINNFKGIFIERVCPSYENDQVWLISLWEDLYLRHSPCWRHRVIIVSRRSTWSHEPWKLALCQQRQIKTLHTEFILLFSKTSLMKTKRKFCMLVFICWWKALCLLYIYFILIFT